MSLKEEKSADLARIIAEIGEPVMWNGKTFQALVSSLTISQDLADFSGIPL